MTRCWLPLVVNVWCLSPPTYSAGPSGLHLRRCLPSSLPLGWSEAPPPTGGNLEGRPQCLFGEHTAGLFHLLLVVAVGLLVLIPRLDLSVTSYESGVEISQMWAGTPLHHSLVEEWIPLWSLPLVYPESGLLVVSFKSCGSSSNFPLVLCSIQLCCILISALRNLFLQRNYNLLNKTAWK